MKHILTYLLILITGLAYAQPNDTLVAVSLVHNNIFFDTKNSRQYIIIDDMIAEEVGIQTDYDLNNLKGTIIGTSTGLFFDFGVEDLNGKLIYGFIPQGDSKYPHPVYFKIPIDIRQGKAGLNIKHVLGRVYDMVGWASNGEGTLGYRIIDNSGKMLYDGIVRFTGTGPFQVAETITEGPFINLLSSEGATISFDTNMEIIPEVVVDGKTFKSKSGTHHEISVSGLMPDKEYDYTVKFGEGKETYSFRTAPNKGSRSKFTFAYASDSRSGKGGGERDFYGPNFYMMKKIGALTSYKNARFIQFTGDLVSGYLTNEDEMDLQYANWKRSIGPFGHYFPVIAGMGNHEAIVRMFRGPNNKLFRIDKYPYEESSAEAVFARNFVNPDNGPKGEDGASYDPNPQRIDFPSYKENVFYYTYDNVAVINMNSNYWYSPSKETIPEIGGGLHGYIMDNQLRWVKKTIKALEKDSDIDHIFITEHTPFFPNGGHVSDDMWYFGNNEKRPWVAGKPLKKGIIERRDELLDLFINESTKVIAILTGDEHNYCRTEIGPNTKIYKEDWDGKKLELSRTIYQVNNGAAGAPYYAQEQTPWTPFTSGFTTQNALVFFHIEGEKVIMEVMNPDTLEQVDELELR